MSKILSILTQTFNPGKGYYGLPYNSNQGFSNKGQLIVFLIILTTGLYITLRVWWSLRKDKKRMKRNL